MKENEMAFIEANIAKGESPTLKIAAIFNSKYQCRSYLYVNIIPLLT